MSDDLVEQLGDLAAQREGRRFWAAMMLARDVETMGSILRGLPVRREWLDRRALKRAGRGAPISSDEWIWITAEMLDAIAEGGPFR